MDELLTLNSAEIDTFRNMFNNADQSPLLIAADSIINFGPNLEKLDSNSAVVYWKTKVPGSAVARFGTDLSNMDQQAKAPWGGNEHRVTLTGLQPNTTYYFQVKSGEAEGSGTSSYSMKYKFTTPAAGAAAQTNVQPTPAQ